MRIHRRAFVGIVAAAAVTLAGCGFQLRGSGGQSSLPFKTLYLNVPETSAFGVQLRRYIRAGGETQLASDAQSAEATLDVLSETRDRTVRSLNTQGRIREISLFYKLRFRVRDAAGKELIPANELTLRRDVGFNESQVIAKEAEEELLYRDMQSDMVQQVLRRLAALR